MPWTTQDLMNQRTEFAMKSLQTDNFRALCREYGISPRVGYKWQRRLLAEGLGGMREKSRRPAGTPQRLDEEMICEIVRLKERHRAWGPRKIREVYARLHGGAPSESSFQRVLGRCGLVERRRVRPAAQAGRIASGRKASAPNEVWTVDFKGWWHDRDGRCEPLTVRDEHSRYVLELRAMEDAKSEGVQRCFERLFARHGLPGAIRSDNGPPFASANGLHGLTRLSAWWLANGIDLERSRPGCPQDNGAHERLHRDIASELEGVQHAERQPAFDTWSREFNEERPHEALGMRVPAEVYAPSARKWHGTPDTLTYPGMSVRRVNRIGQISHEGNRVFISMALAGWDVGLRARGDETLEVHFARLPLGILEPASAAFLPSIPSPPPPEIT